MDEIDRAIVQELRADARLSLRALGRRVGLSPNAVGARVRALLEARVLTGFTAVVDERALGRPLEALIDVRLRPDVDGEDFEAALARLEAVQGAAHLTGRFDYQLQVACRDPADLDATLRGLRRDAGAEATETRVVLRRVRPRPSAAGT